MFKNKLGNITSKQLYKEIPVGESLYISTPKFAVSPDFKTVLSQNALPLGPHLCLIPMIFTLLSLREVAVSPGHIDCPPIVLNTGVPYTGSSVIRTTKKSPTLHVYE